MYRKLFTGIFLIVILSFASCDILNPSSNKPDFTYTFEDGINDWDTQAINTQDGDSHAEWNIKHTTEVQGKTPGSVQFFLDNATDAAKIWIERSFSLESNQSYKVDISYLFGTSDYGTINLWTIITGVHQKAPETHNDLIFHEETGHDQGKDAGLVWLDKKYSFTAETDDQGELIVVVGLWGTSEHPKTHYIDDLSIDFKKR